MYRRLEQLVVSICPVWKKSSSSCLLMSALVRLCRFSGERLFGLGRPVGCWPELGALACLPCAMMRGLGHGAPQFANTKQTVLTA